MEKHYKQGFRPSFIVLFINVRSKKTAQPMLKTSYVFMLKTYVKNFNKITLDKCIIGREVIWVVYYQGVLGKILSSHIIYYYWQCQQIMLESTKIRLIPPWILLTSIISCMLRQGREFCHASVKLLKLQLHILFKQMNGLQ